MSDGKGKGKAKAPENTPNTRNGTNTRDANAKSFLDRVADSAAGLAKSTFAAPIADEVNDARGSAIAGAGKAQSSSRGAGSSAYAENGVAGQLSSSSAGVTGQQTYGAAFPRSSHQQEHVAVAEAEFSAFLDDIPMFTGPGPETMSEPQPILSAPESVMRHPHLHDPILSPPTISQAGMYDPRLQSQNKPFVPQGPYTLYPSAVAGAPPLPYAGNLNFSSPSNTASRTHDDTNFSASNMQDGRHQTVPSAEMLDGQDVVSLLMDTTSSDPTSSKGLAGIDFFAPQSIEEEVESYRLTGDQMQIVAALSKELSSRFGALDPPSHTVPDAQDPLNLRPRAFQSRELKEWLPDEYAMESYMAFGEVLEPGQASERWIEAWEGVLNRYSEEVWGEMAPLVKEAKKELEEIKAEGTEGHQPKALRRLGLVLGHIRGMGGG